MEAHIRQKVLADLQSETPQTKKDAIETLGNQGLPQDIPTLMEAMKDRNPGVRYFARKAIEKIRERYPNAGVSGASDFARAAVDEDRDIEALGSKMENPNFQIRLDAVLATIRHGFSDLYPLLKKRLLVEKHEFVKSALVKGIGIFGDLSAAPLLARFLKDPDARVRANTVEGLELIGDPRVATYVRPFLTDQDNRVRANCFRMLLNYGEESALLELKAMADSSEEWMQQSAGAILRMMERESSEQVISSNLASDNLEERLRGLITLKRLGAGALGRETLQMVSRIASSENGKESAFASELLGNAEAPGQVVKEPEPAGPGAVETDFQQLEKQAAKESDHTDSADPFSGFAIEDQPPRVSSRPAEVETPAIEPAPQRQASAARPRRETPAKRGDRKTDDLTMEIMRRVIRRALDRQK